MNQNMSTNTLLIIDPQNDFMDLENSSLPIQGACDDMKRLSKKIKMSNYDNILVTLDTHFVYNIAHGEFWHSKDGNHPKPFTQIEPKDIIDERWLPVDKSHLSHCINYLNYLETTGKNKLIIWPQHCIINTWGNKVYSELKEGLREWENKNNRSVQYFQKGLNPLTEQYSAIKPEMKIKNDPTAGENKQLLKLLKNSKNIFVAGEALTHCLYFTVKDILSNLVDEEQKPIITIYENASSPVSGFEREAIIQREELISLGVLFKTINN